MVITRNLTPWIILLSFTTVSSAQQFERLVSTGSPRVVNLHPGGLYNQGAAADYVPRLSTRAYAPADPYGVAPVSLASTYSNAVPIASRAIQPGGCCNPQCGTEYPYPVRNVQPGYPNAYPYSTANVGYGSGYGDQYYGRNLLGQPTRFTRAEPVRNIFRWLLP